MLKRGIFFIAVLFLFFYMIQATSAFWLMWLNCEDLEKGIVTPQLIFYDTEPVCFYGGDFIGDTATITLKNDKTKKLKLLTVNAVDGRISSTEGYYFTYLEEGQYLYPSDCKDLSGCRNQDGEYECTESDTSCQLIRFYGKSENCSEDTSKIEKDKDGDGWSDSCDSFPKDPLEKMDFDLDGIGNYNDVDDFDKKIIKMKDPKRGKPPKNDTDEGDNETSGGDTGDGFGGDTGDGSGDPGDGSGGDTGDGSGDPGDGSGDPGDGSGDPGDGSGDSSGGGSSGGGTNPVFPGRECTPEYQCDYWSECVDGKQTRTCTILNGCTIETHPPALEQSCENADIGQVPGVEPTQPEGLPAITGAAVTEVDKPRNVQYALFGVIVIICAAFAFAVYRKLTKKT